MQSNTYRQQCLISTITYSVHGGTYIVQHTHDACWVLALYQITHNLIVEEFDGGPFDPLLYILLLEIEKYR